MRPALLGLLLLLLAPASSALAQAGAPDPTYDQIRMHRSDFGRVLFMRGDSLLRGYPLGFFPDAATAEQRKDPRWDFRSPASTFNKYAPAGIVAVYAGASGQPDSFATKDVEAELLQQLKDGTIRAGDVVIFEDAGLQYASPRDYLKNWRRLRHVFAGSDIALVFMTVADRIKVDKLGGLSANLYRFNYAFDGLSHNDATRIVAENDILIDFEQIARKAEAEFRTPIQPDGIHITIEGQCLLVGALFAALKIEPTGSCVQPVAKPATPTAAAGHDN